MTTPPKARRADKKPRARQTEFADAHRACRTPAEREQLAFVVRAGWTSSELHEYARLYHFRNGRDYPTPMSYRRAIADVEGCERWREGAVKPSYAYPLSWLELFRKGGSKPLAPRREGLLQRGRGQLYRVDSEEYAWPGHTEAFRSMIEQRARDYFNITPEQPVHVNAWAASQRAYWREQEAEAKALAAKAPKSRKKTRRKLAPQFSRDWPGHTDAFREEVDQRVRDDRRLPPGAYVGPGWWKIACNKYYELTDAAPRNERAQHLSHLTTCNYIIRIG
jgi:hypothetical protein